MIKKKKIIIGNWKMNPGTLKEAERLFIRTARLVRPIRKTEVVVCPPFLYLEKLKKHSRKVVLGAQDAFWENPPGGGGPFTGEISPAMLYGLGVRYVILGHSERRTLGEDNRMVNKKVKASLSAGLSPIVCVGEWQRDDGHAYFNLVKAELEECLSGVSKSLIGKIVIAYEPVWAISTTAGRHDATPADSREMSVFIRKVLSDLSSTNQAREIRVIYGGSVNRRDAAGFIAAGGIDGLLPGRASLSPEEFTEIAGILEHAVD
jgi:triosephosphate isomerase (TIM)